MLTFMFSSCYTSTISVGDMDVNDPAVKVNECHNPHFIYGLVSSNASKHKAKEYVKDASSYRIKTQQSFVDGLLSIITFGIYTPTTTTFYTPAK